MNVWKKTIVLCLCSAIMFSLAGCNTASSKSLDVMDSGDFEDVLNDLDYTVSSDGSSVISTKSLDVIDSGDFEDVLEDLDYDFDFYDDEDYLDKGQVELALGYDEDYEYNVFFARYEDEKSAIEEYDLMCDALRTAVESNVFDGTYSMTQGRNFQILIVNGKFDEFIGNFDEFTGNFQEGDTYRIVFQIEDTFITVVEYDNDESDIKEVDKIVEALGYFDASEEDAEFLSEGLEASSYAYDEDMDFYVSFFEYSDEEDAKGVFNNLTGDLKDAKDDEVFDGTSKETQGKNYQKCVINGEFSDSVSIFSEGNTYMVVFQVEETLIVVMAYDNGKSDIKEVDSIVKELGY